MCEVDEEQVNIAPNPEPVPPKLTVTGAVETASVWYADFGGDSNVVVTAENATGDVVWTCTPDAMGVGADTVYTIDVTQDKVVLARGATIKVTANGGGFDNAPVNIVIRPKVTALAFLDNHYTFTDSAGSYAFNLSTLCGDAQTRNVAAQVTTSPDTASAYTHVTWTAQDATPADVALVAVDANGNQGTGNTSTKIKGLALNTTQKVTVKVDTKATANNTESLTIDVRDPATEVDLGGNLTVKLNTFTFAGDRFAVLQETYAKFRNPFSAVWTKTDTKLPQAYSATKEMLLEDTYLEVVSVPTNNTKTHVRASAYFVLNDKSITVLSDDTDSATTIKSTSAIGQKYECLTLFGFSLDPLPSEIMYNNPLLIFWEVSGDDGITWAPLRVTANEVYITAQAPVPTTYNTLNTGFKATGNVFAFDSLLAMSCGAAKGTAYNNATQVRDNIAQLFANLDGATGNNTLVKRLNRQSDGTIASKDLKYWYQHSTGRSPAQNAIFNPRTTTSGKGNMFTNPDGNISCCVWAQLQLMMWALHGKNDAYYVQVVAAVADSLFLVRNWKYSRLNKVKPDAFTHTIVTGNPSTAKDEAASISGLPGQNNANPPPQFRNHFIVLDSDSNCFFDPSYGTVQLDKATWLKNSLAGLEKKITGFFNFFFGGGTWKAGYVTKNTALPNEIEPASNIVKFVKLDKTTWSSV